ncbi:MAG: hypothetical protein H6Q97_471 [Nitrospirae bacterium]|nr:hypothetical protein [Nitrospirota bacterium]
MTTSASDGNKNAPMTAHEGVSGFGLQELMTDYAAPILPTLVDRREILREAVVRWMMPAEAALS